MQSTKRLIDYWAQLLQTWLYLKVVSIFLDHTWNSERLTTGLAGVASAWVAQQLTDHQGYCLGLLAAESISGNSCSPEISFLIEHPQNPYTMRVFPLKQTNNGSRSAIITDLKPDYMRKKQETTHCSPLNEAWDLVAASLASGAWWFAVADGHTKKTAELVTVQLFWVEMAAHFLVLSDCFAGETVVCFHLCDSCDELISSAKFAKGVRQHRKCELSREDMNIKIIHSKNSSAQLIQ